MDELDGPLNDHDREWIAACNEASRKLRKAGVFDGPRQYEGGKVSPYVPPQRMTAKERGQQRLIAQLARPVGKPVGISRLIDRHSTHQSTGMSAPAKPPHRR